MLSGGRREVFGDGGGKGGGGVEGEDEGGQGPEGAC